MFPLDQNGKPQFGSREITVGEGLTGSSSRQPASQLDILSVDSIQNDQ